MKRFDLYTYIDALLVLVGACVIVSMMVALILIEFLNPVFGTARLDGGRLLFLVFLVLAGTVSFAVGSSRLETRRKAFFSQQSSCPGSAGFSRGAARAMDGHFRWDKRAVAVPIKIAKALKEIMAPMV